MISEAQISGLVSEYFGNSDKFLIGIMIKPGNHIRVFIDGDHGVTIEDCQNLSRFIEQKLDRNREDFDLMVSSGGADRPLRFPRQYRQHIGKSMEFVVASGEKLEGTLLSADNESVLLRQETRKNKKVTEIKESKIKFSEIKTAKVVISLKREN